MSRDLTSSCKPSLNNYMYIKSLFVIGRHMVTSNWQTRIVTSLEWRLVVVEDGSVDEENNSSNKTRGRVDPE